MKQILISLSRIATCLTLFLMSLNSIAFAEGLEERWGIGLRLGPSFLVEKLSDKTEGETGLIINGTISYGLTNKVLAGLHVEWEEHTIKDRSSDFIYGEETTVSIIPTIELHPRGGSPFSPYGLLGVGINLNSFRASNDLNASCAPCNVEPKNTLAVKGGVGIDYFMTPNLVYNGELDLKMNDGTSDLSGNIPGFTSGTSSDNSACVLSLIFGARYYY
ncbi:MAG: outer membrane beta-barrel protein [Nitrospiria bacterium]